MTAASAPGSTAPRDRRESPWLPVAGFGALALALLEPALRPGRIPFGFDLVHEKLAWRLHAARRLAAGELPAWSPEVLAGYPFLADPVQAVFYPPSLLFLALPPAWAVHAHYAVHLVLAGLGAHALARTIGVGRAGAWLAGISYQLNGFLVGHLYLGELNHLAALALTPWLLVAADRVLAAPRPRSVATTGVLVALLILTGHLQYAIHGVVALGIVWVVRTAVDPAVRRPAAVGALAASGLLGLGLAAVQVLPSLLQLLSAGRGEMVAPDHALLVSLPPALTPLLALPTLLGDGARTPYTGGLFHSLVAAYPGLVAWLFALVGWSRGTVALRLPWLVLAILGVLFALGRHTPIYPWLFETVPGLGSMRLPVRWLSLFALGLAILAGQGLDAASRREDRAAVLPLGLAAVALLGLAGLVLTDAYPEAVLSGRTSFAATPTPPVPDPGAVLRGLALSVLVIGLAAARPAHRRSAIALTLVLAALDGLQHGRRFVVPVSIAPLLARPPELPERRPGEWHRVATLLPLDAVEHPPAFLESYGRMNRFAQSFHHRALLHGDANVAGVFWVLPAGYADLCFGEGTFEHRFVNRRPLLDLLGVRDLLVPSAWWPIQDEMREGLETVAETGDRALVRNPRALPRAFLVESLHRVADPEAARARVRSPGFDPRAEAIVVGAPPGPGARSTEGRVSIRDHRPEEILLEVETPAPAFVVLADQFDEGWTAERDGEPLPLLRTDLALRGLDLPAGTHRIRLAYRTPGLRAGATLTLGSLIVGFALAAGRRTRRDALG